MYLESLTLRISALDSICCWRELYLASICFVILALWITIRCTQALYLLAIALGSRSRDNAKFGISALYAVPGFYIFGHNFGLRFSIFKDLGSLCLFRRIDIHNQIGIALGYYMFWRQSRSRGVSNYQTSVPRIYMFESAVGLGIYIL